MKPQALQPLPSGWIRRRSFKSRVTLFTLVFFVLSIWLLVFYASRTLREDLQRQTTEQQYASVSLLASELNQELDERIRALEKIATKISPLMLGPTHVLQTYLDDREIFQSLFSGGVVVYGPDGLALAADPLSYERIGVNFMDQDYMVSALRQGRVKIGQPVLAKGSQSPGFVIAVPIRNLQGRVMGALGGVVNLGRPNFLDMVARGQYGKGGDYFLVDKASRLIVTASDKRRLMQPLSAHGAVPGLDQFVDGYEGTLAYRDQAGEDVLAAGRQIPVAGWSLTSTQSASQALAPVRAMQQRLLLAAILLTLLTGALTWWMLRRLLLTLEQRVDALRTSEQRFRAIANSTVYWEVWWGPDAKPRWINSSVKEYTGYTVDECMAMPDFMGTLVYGDDMPRMATEILKAQQGVPREDLQFRLVRKDGSLIWISISWVPVFDGMLRFTGFHSSGRDITEHKRTHDALLASELRWKEANEAKITFLAQMSHELRTPLDTILGNAQLLSGPHGKSLWEDGLASIQKSGWHLLGMINEILDFSRGVAGKLAIEPELLDWPAFLLEVEKTAQILASVNDNKFTLQTSGVLLRGVLLDERRVRQVLDNLLANAARHTQKGRIRLDCAVQLQDGGQLKINFDVCDSGDGILPADQARIFLPFERGSTQTRAGGKGMGMGLAISRLLVEAMGGQLTLTSTPGEGSVFSFSVLGELKMVPEWSFPVRKNRRMHTHYEGPRRTVLVVEDELMSRQVLAHLLQESGFEVLEADSGQSATRILDKETELDLVLTDQFMADGDGWTVLQAVHERFLEVPVVMVSAAPPQKPDNFPPELTCAAHMLKPAHHLELLQLIGNLLNLEWVRPESVELAIDAAPAPVVWSPAEGDAQVLRQMVSAGRVSDIMDWATALQTRDPDSAEYARQVQAAARILDFKALGALAGT